jgi:hypothetical protein
LKIYEPREGTTRTVVPIPEIPTFRVEVRRMPDAETNEIFDRNKIYPNSPKNTMAKLTRLIRDTVVASVVSWEGEEAIFGTKVPCDDLGRERLLKVIVKHPGPDGDEISESLWTIVSRVAEEAEMEEVKN